MKEHYLFEWDQGNMHKSVLKHGITNIEAESVFYDPHLKVLSDDKHSHFEIRYICVGESMFGRLLCNIVTQRNEKIRIISSRIANKKLTLIYGSTVSK